MFPMNANKNNPNKAGNMSLKLLSSLAPLLFAIPAFAVGPVELKTQTDVGVTTTSTQALAANVSRTYLIFQNKGTASVFLKFGSAHSGSEGIEVIADGNYEMTLPPVEAVFLVSASGTQTVAIIEAE